MVKITIIIPTLNKPEYLRRCIGSVIKCNYSNFEIIVVDQGDRLSISKKEQSSYGPKIKYFKVNWRGKTRALNFAIKKSSGDIVAATDDDCMVSRNWLNNIADFFERNKDISLVSGQVEPYKKGINKHKKVIIPDYRLIKYSKNVKVFNTLSYAMTVVTGNNIAIRKELFNKIGIYKSWLGPGTNTFAGEDTEIAIRAILSGNKIAYAPSIKVYHDGFVEIGEFERKEFLYFCGYLSVFVYYFVSGNLIFLKFLRKALKLRTNNWIKQIFHSSSSFHPRNTVRLCIIMISELFHIVKAIVIPLLHIFKAWRIIGL